MTARLPRPSRARHAAVVGALVATPALAVGQCEEDELTSAVPGFAGSVALLGDRALVGATLGTGTVVVYERAGGVWQEVDALLSGSATPDAFGADVALGVDRAVVGAPIDDEHGMNAGAAHVFERVAGSWKQVAKLTASDAGAGARFGTGVALAGDVIVVGAPETGTGTGYVFERIAGSWVEVDALTGSDSDLGDFFAQDVDVDGDTVVCSARLHDLPAWTGGAVYVFERRMGQWTETQKVVADDISSFDQFGRSLALDGDRLLVGSFHDDVVAAESGSAYVFERTGSTWTQTAKLLPNDGRTYSRFGIGVALDGDVAVVGAAPNRVVYAFELDADSWTLRARIPRGPGQFFGMFIAVDGDEILVGDREDPSNGTSGTAPLYRLPAFAQTFCFCPDLERCGQPDTGCTNSLERGSLLSVCGSGSVAADDLVVSWTALPQWQLTQLLMGPEIVHLPLGNGIRCVGAGDAKLLRFPARSSGLYGVAQEGPGLIDLAERQFGPLGTILPGSTWYFQACYMDPVGPRCGAGRQPVRTGSNLSSAVAVSFSP